MEYSDLEKLIDNEVSEGWTVEYKREFVRNDKIAKSIASFANSEGGWYIIGIEENGKNVASQIKGIDLKEIKNPENQLNTAIKDNIRPIPFFKTKLIECPNDEYVLVVYVQKGYDVPYLTKDAKIYQRIGESSDPKPLNDRYLFEKLMTRREEFDLNFKVFAQNEWINSIDQSRWNQPYLEFYAYLDNEDKLISDNFFSKEFFDEISENFRTGVPIPWLSDALYTYIHSDEFKENTENWKDISLSDLDNFLSCFIPFSNHYTSINSHILRGVDDNFQYVNSGLILELFSEGHFKFILPFNTIDMFFLNYSLYEYLLEYESIFSIDEKKNLNVINLAPSLLSFRIILEQYKRLLIKYDMDCNMRVLIKFKNIELTTPFLDDLDFIDFIYKNKLPINFKEEISLPFSGNYIKLNLNDLNSEEFLLDIALALGFPKHLNESLLKGFIRHLGTSYLNNEK